MNFDTVFSICFRVSLGSIAFVAVCATTPELEIMAANKQRKHRAEQTPNLRVKFMNPSRENKY